MKAQVRYVFMQYNIYIYTVVSMYLYNYTVYIYTVYS